MMWVMGANLLMLVLVVPTVLSQPMAPPSPPNVAASKQCPPGYTLVGKYCEMTEYNQPRTVCAPGLNLVNGQCQQLAPQSRTCPARYQLQGEWCEMYNQVPAEFICRDGVLDESGKSCRIVSNQEPMCPNGYQDEGGRCARYSFPLRECREGYSMQGDDCTRAEVVAATPQCAPSSRFDSTADACISLVPQAIDCPASFTLYPQLNRCIRPRPKILSTCPAGSIATYSAEGTEICETQTSHPLVWQCPAGQRLDQNRGLCTREAGTAGVDCPAGLAPSLADPTLCERELPPIGRCPPGTVMDGWGATARCKAISQTEFMSSCPEGFSLVNNGECLSQKMLEPLLVCDRGTLHGNMCIHDKYIAVQNACPEGFDTTVGPSGTSCSRIVKEPCAVSTEYELKCDLPHIGGVAEESVVSVPPVVVRDYGGHHVVPVTEEYEEKFGGLQRVHPLPSHPQQHHYAQSRRLKADVPRPVRATPPVFSSSRYSPASRHAPPSIHDPSMAGYTRVRVPSALESSKSAKDTRMRVPRKEKSKGVEVRPIVPQKKCRKVAVTSESMCSKEEVIQPKKVCPAGSELAGKKCRVRSLSPPLVKCKDSASLDETGTMCVLNLSAPPKHLCPPGSELGEDQRCYIVAQQPPQYTCPEGSVPGGTSGCVQRVRGLPLPNQLIASQATPFCVRGVPQGNQCVEIARQVRTLVCPPGTVENRFQAALGECIEPAEARPPLRPNIVGTPSYVCPDGRPSTGRMCHITDIVKPQMTCPTGTRLENTQCVRTTKMVPRPPRTSVLSAISSCPPGYTQRGDQCVTSHKQPATISCPAGFERRANDCVRIASPQQICPPGTEQTIQGCRSRRQVPPQITVVRQCVKGTVGC